MICVTSQLHPSDSQRFAANGIEAVCCMNTHADSLGIPITKCVSKNDCVIQTTQAHGDV